MSDAVRSHLKPVRRRQQRQFALHVGVIGLLVGSCLAVALAIARLLGAPLRTEAVFTAPAAGLGLGLAIGMLWRRSWLAAAKAVDSHYRFKDRAATALAFQSKADAGELHHLQIADAVEHLKQVDARHVAPLRVTRALPCALAALAVAALLILVPSAGETARAATAAPLPEILAEAERLEQTMLEELEELAQEQRDEELEKLVEELKELVEEMKEPGVDPREALAKLSEMEQAIAEAQAEFNLEAVDAQLKELGEALAVASTMQTASAALIEGNYDKAASELEQFDGSKLDRKEAKALSDQLKKLAKDMQDAGQGELSEATSELAEGLDSESSSQCKGGACKLAGMCKSQGLRKSIGECLACQLAKLGECKGACAGAKNGGNSVAKSDSPKNTWGTGASNQPFGDGATDLGGTRQREDITGVQGDGPSEKEVSHSAEGREQAGRSYREKYQEYSKTAEAVLDSEPLPLGHRQTIRRYFESIRPQNVEDTPDAP